jgi:broad specificity phosphatase PhoE
MKDFNETRKQIKQIVSNRLSVLPQVGSITFVGSFETGSGISTISDIDIIVIVDHLNESLFKTIQHNIQSIQAGDFGLPGHQVLVNTTFGPLKFNDEKSIVFHLMVYDDEMHRKHVNESPFTCYDWEHYPAVYGKHLKEIYPVQLLQLNDLVNTRRSLNTYLQDVETGKISYRKYQFTVEGVVEQKLSVDMDDRHRKEYTYHIMKFMMTNVLKIFHQKNVQADIYTIAGLFGALDDVFKPHVKHLLELVEWKLHAGPEPEDLIVKLREFIADLQEWLVKITEDSPRIYFIRHGETVLNDGCFLGQGRDPGILPVEMKLVPGHCFDQVVTSSLYRAIETGNLLSALQRSTDPLLNEIDYGKAEGMRFDELEREYPNILIAWKKGEDPKFPEGENQTDVAKRLAYFLPSIMKKKGKSLTAVVTHNVVLRSLLGTTFNIPMNQWYMIMTKHLDSFEFIVYQNKLLPALKIDQRIQMRDQIVQWTIKN